MHAASHPRVDIGQAAHSRDHYATLGVPITATNAQIKAWVIFFVKRIVPHKLIIDTSTNQDSTAWGKFHAVSEAYAVPGDDRKRHAHDPNATYDYPWERARTGKYTYYQPPPGAHSCTYYIWSPTNPFSSLHVQRATGCMSAYPPPGTGPSSGNDEDMVQGLRVLSFLRSPLFGTLWHFGTSAQRARS
ncbi:DnaJ-domain-containing protein [Suillus subalutaceus]|uniref:DnaJ-domain-containing protein n=1 Tax=Suillus subalutaceus TaxID=48586 RepID=UPI001B87E7B3|nr:DnaJ-domain-containing protein [Suillus subalutaceus]KAG1867268.1 DnaJ-domain-containing protein [Suillus subalutaceus]